MIDQERGAVFVGREHELGQLLNGLEDAVAGRGRLFLLAGEPGIGKTTLADALASRARDRGFPVLWGRAWEDAGAPPYWPWVQAVRSYVRGTDPVDVRQQMGAGAGDVAQILPELRDLFPDIAPLPDAVSESARFQLFDSTTTFLRNAALRQPLLVVVDDLQAADTPSILLLRFLATQLSQMRVLVVGTYRDVALTPDHPLTLAIAELGREPITRIVTLAGLQAGAVGEFIGAASGLTPHSNLVSAVWRETKGNPLFVGEAVRLLSAEGRINDLADLSSLRIAVPAGIREVIARRISHLGEASARALALGAAIGPEFNNEVLRRVADYGEADALLDLLDEAARAGLLVPVTGVPGRYRFSHDLVRESLYDDLPPARRVRLHQRIAEVLEDLYGSSPGAHLAELAFHFFQATQGAEPAPDVPVDPASAGKAIDYARRAGEQASRSLAFEEAVRLYRMALAVLDRADADPASRVEILLSLGDAGARGGDLAGSRATFLEAAAIARRTNMPAHLARAALGYGGRLPWLRPGKDTRLIPLLQDALVLLGGSDERLRVRLLTRLACAWRSSPDQREQSATFSQQAVELARQQDDPATLSYALAGRYWATWWPENPEPRLGLAEEMVIVAEGVGDAERMIDAHLMLYMALSELGRMADARTKLDDIARLSDELRQPAQLWLGVWPRALVALMEGNFSLAEELVDMEVAWTSPFTSVRDETSSARFHLFLLRREQGRLTEAESAVRAAVEEFPWYPLHRAALACLLFDLGRRGEAQAVFDDLASQEFRALYRDSEWLLGISLTSEACSLLGDASAAAILYGQLSPFSGRHAIGHAEGSLGAVDRYLGLLAGTIGQLDDAERHFSEAIRLNEQMGARPWVAHSQDDLAGILFQRKQESDRDRAVELRSRALRTARALGMTALAARIMERTDVSIQPPPDAAEPGGVGRFRRQGEYWTVAFDGGTYQIRDAKGMRYLARLLAHPGQEQHAMDLARMEDLRGGVASAQPDLVADGIGDAGVRLDPEAKAAYRLRLEDLRSEIAEAEDFNDPERGARARQEMEFLTDELAGAVGLGGRDRKAASSAERARLSVTRAIRAALARIAEQSPALGRHLDATIRTGTFCSYNPDPRVPMSWEV